MSMYNRGQARVEARAGVVDGSFATKVYSWMTIGLALTAGIAYGTYSNQTYLRLAHATTSFQCSMPEPSCYPRRNVHTILY